MHSSLLHFKSLEQILHSNFTQLKNVCNTRNVDRSSIGVADADKWLTIIRLEWVVSGCGGRLRKPSGRIRSPNYPDVYPTSVECIWHIEVIQGDPSRLGPGVG